MTVGSGAGLRCGRISYTNDLPIYAAFDAGEVACPASLHASVPTTLNRMLLAGELDVSPISSFFFAQHAARFFALPAVAIGSRTAVRSIYCIAKTPPSGLSGVEIAVTTESSTGRNLFAAICAEAYGFIPRYVESPDPFGAFTAKGTPCLVIGDKAIDAHLAVEPSHSHDIGELWYGLTGCQMIYALWAVRREVAAERPDAVSALDRALLMASLWGRKHRDRVIADAESIFPRPQGFYAEYYQTLEFNPDAQSWQGLETFFRLAAKHGLLASAPVIERFRMVPAHA